MRVTRVATVSIGLFVLLCAAASAEEAGNTSVTQRRERLRLLRLQALSEYAGYDGEGYPQAIPALRGMLHDESDPEIAGGIIQVLGEVMARDELSDLHRSVTDPVLAAEVDKQLATVLVEPRPVVRQRRISGAAVVAGFLRSHRDVLQALAVVMLAAPATWLALWCFAQMPLRASIARVGLIAGSGLSAVLLGGIAGLLGGGIPRADPGTALVFLIPFLNAVVVLPVVLCACFMRLNARGGWIDILSNAIIWAAVYALLQLGTWAFIPLTLRGQYFNHGIHPRWVSAHVAHSIAVGAVCALIAWRLTIADQRMHVSGPPDELAPGTYMAVLFPCVAVLGLGYLIVNAYAF